jgi:hypothetical protein
MCHFISWAKYDDEVYFITDKEINSRRGKEVIKELKLYNRTLDTYSEDILGHSFLHKYYDLPYGYNLQGVSRKECTKFINKDGVFSQDFPNVIKKALSKFDRNFKYIRKVDGFLNDEYFHSHMPIYKYVYGDNLVEEFEKKQSIIEMVRWGVYNKYIASFKYILSIGVNPFVKHNIEGRTCLWYLFNINSSFYVVTLCIFILLYYMLKWKYKEYKKGICNWLYKVFTKTL